MSSNKNAETMNDLNKPYEDNEIGLRGILWFGVGLLLLIIVTFGLMWALLNVLEDYDRENAGPVNPLSMSERERLPPEPRLQLAPGFGVESETGRMSLELLEPQAEYRVLRQQWDDVLERGMKDARTGAVIALPIEEAKDKLLSQGVKARSGVDAEEMNERSRSMVSDSSSGRFASEKRR